MAAAALAGLASSAQAQAQSESVFSVSGFGTLGVVGTNQDGAEYVVPGQVRGADKSWSGEVDSKLGLQLGAKFNRQFSATLQVLSKQDGKGKFTPQVEWAFAKWQATPGLALRAGRMGGPFFAVSDFRDVGYANTWLRPPIDVYGQVPVSHFDGADLSWQTSVAGKALGLQVFGGRSSSHVEHTKVEIDALVGVNASIELLDGLSLRLGHATGKLTVHSGALNDLVGVLRRTPFAGVGDQLDPNDKRASFSGVGLTYDQGNWIVLAEYTMRKTKTFIPDTTGWYTTVGYRVGKFTPYATLSRLKTDDSNVDNTIPASVVLPGMQAPLRVYVDGATAAQSTPQKTIAVGVRWDAMRNLAVKAQFDRIKTTGAGQFYDADAGFWNKRVHVYSLAVDFVF
ncbi:hypothetical protein GCM10007320_39920 [Pseudorhodoferax aquiterrae]|uniref:Porin domain-containing protein n=2 Tax=Pseudorhodoferax aquiterrae TaxID=747304 RepID=A0ABQ3G5U8_9BURK|nr:hypothetical protein GCM10007320_39920 [Pseudorhodoferax aquiterrae]